MTQEEISKNAPDGATHYNNGSGWTVYVRLTDMVLPKLGWMGDGTAPDCTKANAILSHSNGWFFYLLYK